MEFYEFPIRLGISSSLTIRHSYFSGNLWLNHQCLLRQRHKHHEARVEVVDCWRLVDGQDLPLDPQAAFLEL